MSIGNHQKHLWGLWNNPANHCPLRLEWKTQLRAEHQFGEGIGTEQYRRWPTPLGPSVRSDPGHRRRWSTIHVDRFWGARRRTGNGLFGLTKGGCIHFAHIFGHKSLPTWPLCLNLLPHFLFEFYLTNYTHNSQLILFIVIFFFL